MRKLLIVAALIWLVGAVYAQEKEMEQKEISVSTFNQVKFEGGATWVLVPSATEKVVLESKTEDVFDYIEVRNDGHTLVISTTGKNKNITKLFKSVTIKVYFKTLGSVALSGTGSVSCLEQFPATELTATLRGAGDMNLDVACSRFFGNMYGTGSLNVKGTADKAVIRVEGVGGFAGYNLVAENVDVTVSGVGGANVHATNSLSATLNGVGSIRYMGNPVNKNLNTNGLGNIKKVDDSKK